jgi:glutamate synthase (NADPH) small chain
MGKITGFLEFERNDRHYEPVEERIKHWREFVLPLPEAESRTQAARCMDCGVPYCHTGCPVNNQIPDWNDLVYRGDWEEAAQNLHSTNNFPEFTGRVCPAPCEASCTLNLDDNPVTIKTIECAIVDRAFEEGWVKPEPPSVKTGKRIAVVGSGPAGLACAQQLGRAGHDVHVFEKHAKAGGLLRYGIPDFKMEKHLVDRRVTQMAGEGVVFHYGAHVGGNVAAEKLVADYDAVVLAGGAEKGRELPIPGRELKGVHFAMEFLPQQNRRIANEPQGDVAPILAGGKHVVVIGGGDTAMDCVRTAVRQGAVSVQCLYRRDQVNMPGSMREVKNAQEEGVEFVWLSSPEAFHGDQSVTAVKAVKMRLGMPDASGRQSVEPSGEHMLLEADLVIKALGFDPEDIVRLWGVNGLEVSRWGTLKVDHRTQMTTLPGVFAAGDIVRGASLVVWAIKDGRDAAARIHDYIQQAALAVAAE